MNFEKIKLGEFNALQQKFKSLNKYEKPINKQMQDTESKKDAIRHDMRVLNRWVADQYAKLLSYKVESMDIPTRDFTGMTSLNARKSKKTVHFAISSDNTVYEIVIFGVLDLIWETKAGRIIAYSMTRIRNAVISKINEQGSCELNWYHIICDI